MSCTAGLYIWLTHADGESRIFLNIILHTYSLLRYGLQIVFIAIILFHSLLAFQRSPVVLGFWGLSSPKRSTNPPTET